MSASIKNARMLSSVGTGFANKDGTVDEYEGSLHREAGNSRARSLTEVCCLLSLLAQLFEPQATIKLQFFVCYFVFFLTQIFIVLSSNPPLGSFHQCPDICLSPMFVLIIFQHFPPRLVLTASSEQEQTPDMGVKLLGQVVAQRRAQGQGFNAQ